MCTFGWKQTNKIGTEIRTKTMKNKCLKGGKTVCFLQLTQSAELAKGEIRGKKRKTIQTTMELRERKICCKRHVGTRSRFLRPCSPMSSISVTYTNKQYFYGMQKWGHKNANKQKWGKVKCEKTKIRNSKMRKRAKKLNSVEMDLARRFGSVFQIKFPYFCFSFFFQSMRFAQ